MILVLLALFTTMSTFAADGDFPGDYETSRARFRAGCAERARGPNDFCRALKIPSAQFEDLTTDAAYFTRGGRHLLVMQSGTHGPESYAGAAIQDLAMRKHLDQLLARGIDVLLIHALNPFGFRTGRRVDEGNVNLNRNFVARAEDYQQINLGYRKLRWAFEPTDAVSSPRLEHVKTARRLLWQYALDRFDKRPINEAMNMGQYEFERGLNFGGRGPTPQVALLRELLTPVLAKHRKIVFVDWHTGLGDKGTLHWMAGEASTPTLVNLLKPTLERLKPLGVKSTLVAEDKNFFRTTGGVEVFAARLAPPGAEVIGATAEFGTLGTDLLNQVRSAHRMIVENHAWFNGCATAAACEQVHQDFLEMFNPTDPAWRAGVLDQADHFLTELAVDFGASASLGK